MQQKDPEASFVEPLLFTSREYVIEDAGKTTACILHSTSPGKEVHARRMTSPMILILSFEADPHLTLVTSHLDAMGQAWLLLATDQVVCRRRRS